MTRIGNNVRLTEQAHTTLSKMAEKLNVSMKEIASEAIFVLAQKEGREKEQRESIEIYEKRVAILSRRIRGNRHAAFGAFVLGAITSGCAVYFSVVVL